MTIPTAPNYGTVLGPVQGDVMINPILAMAGIVIVTIIGDWALKMASLREGFSSGWHITLGMAMYMLSGFGFVVAMRHMSLASVGVWYAVLTILMMTALGVFVFGERLSAREIIGVGFALISLSLMTRLA